MTRQLQSAAEERVFERVRAGRDELVGIVSELISYDTTSREPGEPARDEEKLQRFLAGRLQALEAEVDLWEPEPTGTGNRFVPDDLDFVGRPQLLARVPGGGGGPTLFLNGHIDAVTPGDLAGWTSDPLRGTVRDGRLYGRGVCDMKGGIGGLLFALECLRREGIRLQGDVLFCTNTDEESSGAGGYAVVSHGVRASAGICAEPTGFDVWPACRGTWMTTLTIPGRAGHAEMVHPHWREGGVVNAIEKLPIVLDTIRGIREDWRTRLDHRHPLLAPGDVVPTVVRGGEWIVTYPASCSLTLDVTYLPKHVDEGGSGAAIGREVMDRIGAALSADPWFAYHPATWQLICDTVPAEIPGDDPFVGLLLATAEDLGRSGTVVGLNSWHDAATYTRAGLPTVSFGPGGFETAHALDECVSIDDLVDFAAATAIAAMRFCGC
ncbi:MAG: M20/M25/M40 family metallo-hydrolase [Thermoleophilia bacterium]|nr:M20/M25/M40 family metallo-hydrolase [Thermoleophilia bacterium]